MKANIKYVCPPRLAAVIFTAGMIGLAAPAVALAFAVAGRLPPSLTAAATQQAEEKEDPENMKADSLKRLRRIRTQMRKERKELGSVMEKEESVLGRLEALQKNLQSSRSRLEKLESQITVTKQESLLLEEDIRKLKQRADKLKVSMNKRLRAHYRFSRTGLARVLFTAKSVADLSRRMGYMDAVFRKDRKRLDEYAGLLGEWRKVKQRLKEKQELFTELKKTAAEQQEEMQKEKETLNAMLAGIRQERRRHEAALSELEASKRRLQGMISSLEKKKEETVEKVSKVLDNLKGFVSRRGSLCYPAPGHIVVSFGKKVHPRFNTETMQNGVEIKASRGTPVKAVAPGVVRFAKWFRGYGNMVIVDHGNSYYTIYAHLAAIRVRSGQSVKIGDVLGTVGDTGSMQGPSLYFEIRHHQSPINPESWLGSCSM